MHDGISFLSNAHLTNFYLQQVSNVKLYSSLSNSLGHDYRGVLMSAGMKVSFFSLALLVLPASGYLYAVGGSTTDSVERYDESANSWSSMESLPAWRNGHGAGVISGILYVAGGTLGPGGGYTDTVISYNPTSNAWTTGLATISSARGDMSCAPLSGYLYCAGGYTSSDFDALEKYDPSGDSWSTMTSMGTARRQFGLTSLGGYLYACGGSGSYSSCEKYDPSGNSWSSAVASMSAHHDRIEAVGSYIYAFGGQGGTDTIETYDPSGNSWSTLTATMSSGTWAPAGAGMSGNLYYSGGAGNTFLDKVDLSGTPSRSSMTAMSTGRYKHTLSYIDPATHVAGDPHISFADGGHADFRGSHRAYYAFVSSPGFQFAPHFQEVDFWFHTVSGLTQLVHGTFMTKAAWRVRTSAGKELLISADAMKQGELVVFVLGGSALNTPKETIAVKQWQRLVFDDMRIETRMLTASVESAAWLVNITSKPIYNLVPPIFNETHLHVHWEENQRRFDILIQGDSSQPDAHGIIGQSYRGGTAGVRNGKLDEYGLDNYTTIVEKADSDGMLPPMTTSAQAEGAIEGVYTDYQLPEPIATDFKFSSFKRAPRGAPSGLVTKRMASTSEWDGKKWAGKKRDL